MMDNIKETQPILYNLVYNANKENRRNHAFLLSGTNTKEAVQFLIKSILCDQLVACNECNTCKRVDEKKYNDIIYYDGDKESIKKRHIDAIRSSFIATSLEGKSKIYVLENIDKSSKESMNSLLKMLEEPEGDTVAIFSTKNKARILPTIVSRCQVIDLKPDNKQIIKSKLVIENIELAYANLLAEIAPSYKDGLELYDERFCYMYHEAFATLQDMYTNPDNVLINIHTNLLMKYKKKDDVALFFDIFVVGLKDLLRFIYGQELVFEKEKAKIQTWNIDENQVIDRIQAVLMAKQKLGSNMNIGLLIDSLFYKL